MLVFLRAVLFEIIRSLSSNIYLDRAQIRHLWLTFLMEVRAGMPPAISANTENLMLATRIQSPLLARGRGDGQRCALVEDTGMHRVFTASYPCGTR